MPDGIILFPDENLANDVKEKDSEDENVDATENLQILITNYIDWPTQATNMYLVR